jgi:hypothetical protein
MDRDVVVATLEVQREHEVPFVQKTREPRRCLVMAAGVSKVVVDVA